MLVCKNSALAAWAFGIFFLFSTTAFSQSLLDELEAEADAAQEKEYAFATFKGVRVINGHSVEMPGKGELLFIIQHRFGRINTGFSEMFGWDQASIRIGLEYTLPFSERFNLGFGRSSYGKTWDGFLKTKILKQSKPGSPVTLTSVNAMTINTMPWANPNQENFFSSRLAYVHQLLIARKFNSWFSLQLSPSLVHKNLVPDTRDQNTFFVMGFSGRAKISNRVAINAEYFWLVPGQEIPQINNADPQGALSIGVDWETGGHVFQFQLTNAQAMFDMGFMSETIGRWDNGDIHFGFNITRTFSFGKKAKKAPKD